MGLYNIIKKHKDPRTKYTEKLIMAGEIEAELARKMDKEFNTLLQDKFSRAKEEVGL